jgi:hypothetical protein
MGEFRVVVGGKHDKVVNTSKSRRRATHMCPPHFLLSPGPVGKIYTYSGCRSHLHVSPLPPEHHALTLKKRVWFHIHGRKTQARGLHDPEHWNVPVSTYVLLTELTAIDRSSALEAVLRIVTVP